MRAQPRRSVGRAFPVTRKQVRGLDHVRPRAGRHHRNPGVTAIAAINGRGAYRGRRTKYSPRASARPASYVLRNSSGSRSSHSRRPVRRTARQLMRNAGSRGARISRARHALSDAQRRAFATKVRARLANSSRSTARARKNGTKRRAKPNRRKATMSRRMSAKQRAAARRNLRKARAALRAKRGGGTRKRRRRVKAKAAPKRRRRRRLVRNRGTRAGALKGWRTRRRRRAKASTKPRRRRRRKATTAVAPRRRRRRSRAKAAAPRRRRRRGKRKLSMKKSARRARARRRAKKRMASSVYGDLPSHYRKNRRRRKARRNGRRKARRNAYVSNPRRRRRKARRNAYVSNRRRGRRRARRNGRSFRRNPAGFIGNLLLSGGKAFGGFIGHRITTNLFKKYIVDKFFPAATVPAAGIGALDRPALIGLGSSVLVAAGELFVANKLIKDSDTKKLVMAGIGASVIQQLIVGVLRAVSQTGAADMLSGSDGTAARISAMYGMQGTSIMPRYAPIGEYFSSGVRGVGEYFSSGVQGLGGPVYQAAAGMGQYGPNPDLYQAAAGFGTHDNSYGHSSHVDPSSNLDRELSIAEAAAGVGALPRYEASAGVGEYFSSGVRGLGDDTVSTVPSESTWVPGESDPALWAGVKAVDEGQEATEMLPAGILETSGGQGIFG